jgi:DNA-binding XRE family transcriptional regulator
MGFGSNLQFLRKLYNGMTQEELADRMEVSRQTISKWETDRDFPEMEKAIALCNLFNCSLDDLFRNNINMCNFSYKNIRVEMVKQFVYYKYTVISEKPEEDAKRHFLDFAKMHKLSNYTIIGWDFPSVTQEQINVFHMHGYQAACIVDKDINDSNLIIQPEAKYVAITIVDPFSNPFVVIPNAYKTLYRYMETNGLQTSQNKEILSCFEKEYIKEKVQYMDIYIAVK